MPVHFSHHCFTTAYENGEFIDARSAYTDTRRGETRKFCPARWALSKELAGVIRGLQARRCYLTGRDNFFTVNAGHQPGDYIVYFNIRMLGAGKALFFVESAYVRFDAPQRQRGVQKISLSAILRNVRLGCRPRRSS